MYILTFLLLDFAWSSINILSNIKNSLFLFVQSAFLNFSFFSPLSNDKLARGLCVFRCVWCVCVCLCKYIWTYLCIHFCIPNGYVKIFTYSEATWFVLYHLATIANDISIIWTSISNLRAPKCCFQVCSSTSIIIIINHTNKCTELT